MPKMDPNARSIPRVRKFFFCLDLKIGVALILTIEVGLWALLSVVALDNESEFFASYDLYKFEEVIEDNWYFEMIFGAPTEEDEDYELGYEGVEDDDDGIDIEFRYHSIAVNAFLMMTFIAYFILTMIFLVGVAKNNTKFFIPYILYDTMAIWFALMLAIGGVFLVNIILVRNSAIFIVVKIYPSLCNYSLFKKLGGEFRFDREVKTESKARRRKKADSINPDKKSAKPDDVMVEMQPLKWTDV